MINFILTRIKTFVIISFIFICGCSMFKYQTNDIHKFKSYIDEYVKISNGNITKYRMIGLTVNFKHFKKSKTNYQQIGACNYFLRHIFIDLDFWSIASEHERKAILFHELHHCLYGIISHNDNLMEDNCPESLMHSSIPIEPCLIKHWKYYKTELFKE